MKVSIDDCESRDEAEHRERKPTKTLTEALEDVVQSDTDAGPSIGEIVDGVADKGFGILFLVLSLPSALPIPAPGYSTPFGFVIVLIALQMLMGRHVLWLPERLRRVRLNKALADRAVEKGSAVIRWMERFIRPRHQWISSTMGLRLLAMVIISMGCLMILPIPLTNTAPAVVVFLIGFGLSEEDGLLAIGSFAVGCFAVVLYAYVAYLFYAYGPEAVNRLEKSVRSLSQ